MEKFGFSENLILMNDDYFIEKPISKYEMYYEKNGQTYPAIITSNIYEFAKKL